MRVQYCGGCSNHVDPKTAVRWVKADGKTVYFCSEECRVVGENIEPPSDWAPTPKSAIRDAKKVRKATIKKARKATRQARKPRRNGARRAAGEKAAARKPAAKTPAKRARR